MLEQYTQHHEEPCEELLSDLPLRQKQILKEWLAIDPITDSKKVLALHERYTTELTALVKRIEQLRESSPLDDTAFHQKMLDELSCDG